MLSDVNKFFVFKSLLTMPSKEHNAFEHNEVSVCPFLFQSRILFWIWAALPQPELNNYRYEIHFDIPPNMKPLRQHYSGTVKSLEISASELTQHNTHHYRSIVYFTQSHIRRALSFTHNLQQPPPKTLDMKYTVKIMRQS